MTRDLINTPRAQRLVTRSRAVDDWRIPAPARNGTDRSAAMALLVRARILLYHVYVACLLGLNTVALLPVAGAEGSSTPFMISWLALQGLVFLILLSRLAEHPRNAVFAALVGSYMVFSILWSVNMEASASYVPMLVGNIVAAYLVATDLTLAQIVAMCARVITLLAAAGIILYFAGYQQVVYYDVHARPNLLGGQPFRGFFPHKILAGLYMSLAILFTMALRSGAVRMLSCAVLIFGVLLTGSASALVLLLLALAAYAMTSLARDRQVDPAKFARMLVASTIAVSVAAVIFWGPLLNLLGRDDTLTGRTVLWEWGLRAFAERPLFGWGFNAYLNSSYADIVYWSVPSFRNWEIPHFHQSYIQTAVDFGIVGVSILIGMVFYILRASLHQTFEPGGRAGLAVFVAMVTLVAASFIMFLFFNYNNFATFLLFVFFFALRSIPPGQTAGLQGRPMTGRWRRGRGGRSPKTLQ